MSANPSPDAPQRIGSADILCSYCGRPFTPRRSWAVFCSDQCRSYYDTDIGMTGKVARVVRRAKGGVSVTIYFHGPAEDRAFQLRPGDDVRGVKQP